MSSSSVPKALGLTLGLVLGGVGSLYYCLVRRPLPAYTGSTALRGLDGDVEVLWDRWGVPHVYAGTQDDAFFAQGYLHAQDRLWQMEMNRRIGSGRLSEIFGARTLEADRFLRRVGLRRVARQEMDLLDDETAAMMTAYCSGVNAFLMTHQSRLPMEFNLLRFRPEAWSPLDSLTWAKLMGWSLSLNWDVELYRARFLSLLGPEAAAAIEQAYPQGHPITVTPGTPSAGGPAISGEELAALAGVIQGAFSNAWVVKGERSATGKPFLANDPHLIPQLPSTWYEMHLECPQFQVSGASMAGAPGIVIGHNQHIAWGLTASMVDSQDVYIEEFSHDDPLRYKHKGRWRRATRVKETIRVKGQREAVIEEVRTTLHGPVISCRTTWNGSSSLPTGQAGLRSLQIEDLIEPEGSSEPERPAGGLNDLPGKSGSDKAFALRSTLLEPNHLSRAALELALARDWGAFRAALSHWAAPALNFLYADAAGHVGYQLAGRMPRRVQGTGYVPSPGWTGQHEWDGYLDFGELPSAFDPPEGYLVNANNRPMPDGGTSESIYGEWIDGYRAQRIEEMLLSHRKLDADAIRQMQMDALSLPAQELQHLLKDVQPSSPDARWALNKIMQWDCRVSERSVGAAIYEVFRLTLMRKALLPVLGPHTPDYFGMQIHPFGGTTAYQFRGSSFFLRLAKEQSESDGGGVISESLEETVGFLRERFGNDASQWRWGRLHRVSFNHALGQQPLLGLFLNRGPYPLMGDMDTPHQASFSLREPYDATRWQPSLRFIADTSDWDKCLMVHAPGQSGQVGSSHYDDLISLWRGGEYHPMPFSRSAVESLAVSRQLFTAPPRH